MITETVKQYTTAIQKSRNALLNGDLDLAEQLCKTAYDLRASIHNTLSTAYWQLRNQLDQAYDKEDDDTNP